MLRKSVMIGEYSHGRIFREHDTKLYIQCEVNNVKYVHGTIVAANT